MASNGKCSPDPRPLDPAHRSRLARDMGDPDAVEATLRTFSGPVRASRHRPAAAPLGPARIARLLADLGARAVARDHPDYPAGLTALADAPPVIYVRGRVERCARSIAIVGSRAASPYGIICARRLAADLAGL